MKGIYDVLVLFAAAEILALVGALLIEKALR
jgi:hypothetical protein